MRILYVCADWGIPIRGFKGASVHVREFCNTLRALGHEVTLLFAVGGEGNPDPRAFLIELAPRPTSAMREREAARPGIEFDSADRASCRELDKLAYAADFAARALPALRCSGRDFDAVYERYSLFQTGGSAIARDYGIPYVVEVNAPLIEEEERHRVLKFKAVAHEAQTRCFRSADHIVIVSAALKSYVQAEGIASHRISCLPNGVDTGRFHPLTSPVDKARYGLERSAVIGFVGSLKPWHGMDFLFDAMALLQQRGVDYRLLIVGDGPGFEHAKKRSEADILKGTVVLTGKVPHHEIPAHLALMNLTVAPYDAAEDFYFSPLKVMESLAAGRPVVAPSLGQLKDLIENGVTGLLYEPGDLISFVDCLETLLLDPSRLAALGENARRYAVANLSWESVVQRALQIISKPLQAA